MSIADVIVWMLASIAFVALILWALERLLNQKGSHR